MIATKSFADISNGSFPGIFEADETFTWNCAREAKRGSGTNGIHLTALNIQVYAGMFARKKACANSGGFRNGIPLLTIADPNGPRGPKRATDSKTATIT